MITILYAPAAGHTTGTETQHTRAIVWPGHVRMMKRQMLLRHVDQRGRRGCPLVAA